MAKRGNGRLKRPEDEDNTIRSSYAKAVAIYEQAIRTLQQHHYAKAAELLRHVLATYPEERELAERVKLYLNLCERQLKPLTAEPEDTPERLYAATLAINAGEYEKARRHLERVLVDDPGNDQANYMLAVVHSARRERALAIRYLQQAIEANAENRSLARLDPDLAALRADEAVTALLEAPPIARSAEQKRIVRRR